MAHNVQVFLVLFYEMPATFRRREFLALAVAGLAPEMNRKILLAYATRCGSTLEVARAMVQELTARGHSVDLRLACQATSLSRYDRVVLGSAVRYGKWLPEAVDFVRRRQAALRQTPTAFFCVHMRNTGSDEASRKARFAYLDPVRALVRPGVEGYFAGKMDTGKLGLGERMLCTMMKAHNADGRDWAAIRGWSHGLFENGQGSR